MTQTQDMKVLEVLQAQLIDQPNFLKGLLTAALQKILEADFTTQMGATKYERTEERNGYRNGSYTRHLKTRVGCIELNVCRDRDGQFQPELFAKYQRNEKSLVLAIAEMYLKGISTRKIEPVLEELCGFGLSKSTVSKLAEAVDDECKAWRELPLTGEYVYLWVDALVHKVREDGKVRPRATLIVVGVKTDGYREVIACSIEDSESEQGWSNLFKGLKARGLKGVKLVVSDCHTGLKKAIEICFQGVEWQRCQVHFMRNFMSSLPKTDIGMWIKKLQDTFAAPSREEAQERAKKLAAELRAKKKEKQADWLEDFIEDCLSIYSFPPEHWRLLKSTNMVERLNLEIRRRTNVCGVFPNREALLRIQTSECMDASERWMRKKYMAFEENQMSKAL